MDPHPLAPSPAPSLPALTGREGGLSTTVGVFRVCCAHHDRR